jgi:hypothetical protein
MKKGAAGKYIEIGKQRKALRDDLRRYYSNLQFITKVYGHGDDITKLPKPLFNEDVWKFILKLLQNNVQTQGVGIPVPVMHGMPETGIIDLITTGDADPIQGATPAEAADVKGKLEDPLDESDDSQKRTDQSWQTKNTL